MRIIVTFSALQTNYSTEEQLRRKSELLSLNFVVLNVFLLVLMLYCLTDFRLVVFMILPLFLWKWKMVTYSVLSHKLG